MGPRVVLCLYTQITGLGSEPVVACYGGTPRREGARNAGGDPKRGALGLFCAIQLYGHGKYKPVCDLQKKNLFTITLSHHIIMTARKPTFPKERSAMAKDPMPPPLHAFLIRGLGFHSSCVCLITLYIMYLSDLFL